MANEEVLKAIRERDASRAQMIMDIFTLRASETGNGALVIADTLDALAVDWRAEADQWMASETKLKLRTSTELRQAAARVAGVAVKLRELTPADDPLKPRFPKGTPESTTVVPENDDVSAYLRGDTDTIPGVSEHLSPTTKTFVESFNELAKEFTATVGGDTPGTSELNREALAMTDTFPMSQSTIDMFSEPGPPSFAKAASTRRYSFAELLTPPTPASLPGHWSYSQLETSEDCGLKYRAQRIDSIAQVPQWALIGGNAFHACVQQIERAEAAGEAWHPDETADMWHKAFHSEIASVATTTQLPATDWRAANGGKEGYDWWRVEGAQMLGLYAERRTGGKPLYINNMAVIEHELQINVRGPLGDIPFKSIVDQAWAIRDGIVRIVDLKTSRTVTSDTFQLGTQAWALSKYIPQGVVSIEGQYYDARKGVYTPAVDLLQRHPWDEVVYRVHSAEAKRRAGIYQPRPSSFCGGCSVRYACPVGGR